MRKTIFIISIVCGLYSVSFSQEGWFELSNPTIQPYFGVYFLDANTGFVCGAEGTILRTTNGGASWDVSIPEPNTLFYKIRFKDSNTGFAIGSFGVIYKTENKGLSWEEVLPPNGLLQLFDIYFLDNNYGVIVGRRGVTLDSALIMRTTNGGETWPIMGTTFTDQLNAVHFFNYFDGFAVGTNNLKVKTINSGQTWTSLPASTPAILHDVFATSSTNVFAVSPGGIYLSTNAGESWNLNYPGGYLQTILFLNSSTGFAAGRDGNIWKTTNSGNGWFLQHDDPAEELMDIYFVDSDTGFAVGNKNNQGIIYKTTTGGNGTSDIHPISIEVPDKFSLNQNFPNPFNPSTKISWQSPIGSWQTLKIYDLLGNEIATLVNEYLPAGNYEKKFSSLSGSAWNLSSGIYFYILQAGNYIQAKKMILTK